MNELPEISVFMKGFLRIAATFSPLNNILDFERLFLCSIFNFDNYTYSYKEFINMKRINILFISVILQSF